MVMMTTTMKTTMMMMTIMMMMTMLLVSIIGKLKVCRVGRSSSLGSGRKSSLQIQMITILITMLMMVMTGMSVTKVIILPFPCQAGKSLNISK